MTQRHVPFGAQKRNVTEGYEDVERWEYGRLFLQAYFCRYCDEMKECCKVCREIGMRHQIRTRMSSLIRRRNFYLKEDDD